MAKKRDINIDEFMAVSSGSLNSEDKATDAKAEITKPISRKRTNSVQVMLNDREFAEFVKARDQMQVKNSEAGRELIMLAVRSLNKE